MYALTVNDIDAQTYARISSIAFEEECSLGQALHRLISIALEKYPLKKKSSFARFAGRWTAEEAKEFGELTKRTIDEGDWVKIPWVAFRRAIRNGSIDAMTARRIFNKHFKRLGVICKRENCSLEKARTINAALEGEISAALLKAGRLAKGAAYDSVETLLKDLKS